MELDKERKRSLKSRQYNLLFYGNPGTGKTTVARHYAGLLKELGVLPGDAVEETSGAALVNGGLTELKKLLKNLEKGGVLFIDEAYQLKPKTNPQGAQVSVRDGLRSIYAQNTSIMSHVQHVKTQLSGAHVSFNCYDLLFIFNCP